MTLSLLAQGNLAFRNKDYESAIDHYRRAINNDPELIKIIQPNLDSAYRLSARSNPASAATQTIMVDIVVPVYNALEDVKKCLESLQRCTDGMNVKIIVVNDGSDTDTTQWLRKYCQAKPIFKLIENSSNMGYTKSINIGLKATTAQYAITQNSDTIVSPGWLSGLVRCAQSSSKIGIVGPLSNAANWQNIPILRDESGSFAVNDLPVGYSAEDMAKIVRKESAKSYPRLPFVNGFCLMIKREVIAAIGYMDEEKFPLGYGEENDYCIRASDAGFELVIADDVYVFHAKSKSFGHQLRKELSDAGNKAIISKHTKQKYTHLIEMAKNSSEMEKIRDIYKRHFDELRAVSQSQDDNEQKDIFADVRNRILHQELAAKPINALDILTATKAHAVNEVQSTKPVSKLPITVLIITWDVGHNPLGRSYMLAEVVQRIARHSLLVGFQFPRYGDAIWEPVRNGQHPVVTLPGANLPEFFESLERISSRIKPDVVIACKPRLPSVALGMLIKEKWGCPLIVDVDDHELSFFKDHSELTVKNLMAMPPGSHSKEIEPYAEIWSRLTHNLCKSADEIIVSNIALQQEFGGTIVPHVRDEISFDPTQYNKLELRKRYGIPVDSKIVLFFGTPRIHKGIDTLARAVNQITDSNFRLLVVGTAPDRSVTAKLNQLAPERIIYLPNQPFAKIPEILAMADVVCLPQDEGHAISKYQLPAKAIDAVAMGIPLLVTNTPPLMQLVADQVAELVTIDGIPEALVRLGSNSVKWQQLVRSRFLARYSYHAASLQVRELIQRCIARKSADACISTKELVEACRHVLGLSPTTIPKVIDRQSGIDIVLFWKQNDTGLYGRRHDMVIKYLASRADIRKVVVFDAPTSEYDLVQRQQAGVGANQNRWIYTGTYEKLLGTQDSEKISYNVFVYPPGKYRIKDSDIQKPHINEDYISYVSDVLLRENVKADESIFWIYPKNYSAPAIINHFNPLKVVVDVVDDHRAWPGISQHEKEKLTQNYREILALADMVYTNCEPVKKSMEEYASGILLVPNGCDSSPPVVIPTRSPEFDAFCNWPGMTIGYIGNLESKIDIELIDKLAYEFQDCQIVLIGSTHSNPAILKLLHHSNVVMPGVVPYKEVGAWVSNFDVGLVPHLTTELTRNMNPLKIFVYLSFGIPVVSTEVPNIDVDNVLVRVGKTHADFINAVKFSILGVKPDYKLFKKYVEFNDWSSRLNNSVNLLIS